MKTAADVSDRTLAELVDLRGRTALVTGAGQGIGEACARRLAEAGADIVVADVDPVTGAAAAERLRRDGATATSVTVDVADSASVEAAIAEATERVGIVDITVNAAGIYPQRSFLDTDDDLWRQVMAVDLDGAMHVSRAVARRLVAADRGGVIVNVSSVCSFRARPDVAAYIAAKHGLNGLTKAMAFELGPHGIRVLGVAPTTVDTPGVAALRAAREASGQGPLTVGTAAALGRLAVPDDVARVVLFCTSDLAALMTGDTLRVDAGVLLT